MSDKCCVKIDNLISFIIDVLYNYDLLWFDLVVYNYCLIITKIIFFKSLCLSFINF